MRKKLILSISIVLSLSVVITTFYIYRYNNGFIIPNPDKIVVYINGNAIEIKSDVDFFNEILRLNNNRTNKRNQQVECSVELNMIEDIKKDIAVEYIYNNQSQFEINSDFFYFTKLLFPLNESCNEYIIIYNNNEYKSGPIGGIQSGHKLKAEITRLINRQ